MIAKKSKKANLERKRFAFFQIGLLVSGSLCLAAFEYSSAVPEDSIPIYDKGLNSGISVEIPIDYTLQEQPQRAAVVNLDNIENIEVVKKLEREGDPIITDKDDVITIDGDVYGDLLSDDDDLRRESYAILPGSEIEPEFPGGEKAMYEWIGKQMVYPELPREIGIQGIVYVQFVVNKDGSISHVVAKQSPHEDLSKEAKRVVSLMPKWNPGEQAGKKVRVRYTLPIHFQQY
ncbi:MAG: energy transducer TonB [Crocinitomicaceae bacterium]